MLTETWLYSNGDEAYIAAMTLQVTSSVRSLVQDLEEVASAQLFKILFKNLTVCVCLGVTFMWCVCVWCVCVGCMCVYVCVCMCVCVCREGVLVLISM